ncbi:hypothetical protein D3C87_1292280 [compost metagenome]
MAGREIEIGKILARAETAPGTGQQQGAGAAGFHVVERGDQRLVHLVGEAVELVGAVQRDHGHVALPAQQDRAGVERRPGRGRR